MKQQFFTTIILSLTILLVASNTRAQENFVLKSFNASIDGTSSLHDWKSEITDLKFKGVVDVQDGLIKSIKDVEIKVFVQGIKSTKGKIMNNKTYDAFKYQDNPYIIYTFLSGHVAKSSDNNSIVDATGTLSMAGEMKKISFKTNINVLPNGDLQLIISEKVKMTDYKMKKPTAVFGTITVGDEVTVSFNLLLTPTTAHARLN